jgi:hypothetical protein
MLLPVDTNYQGKRLWMVTTSLDKVNDLNRNKYLHTEGSIYKLPMINGIKKWYSTSENIYYKPGDIVKVEHGMHFEALK